MYDLVATILVVVAPVIIINKRFIYGGRHDAVYGLHSTICLGADVIYSKMNGV